MYCTTGFGLDLEIYSKLGLKNDNNFAQIGFTGYLVRIDLFSDLELSPNVNIENDK
jgi:hypothetical protein